MSGSAVPSATQKLQLYVHIFRVPRATRKLQMHVHISRLFGATQKLHMYVRMFGGPWAMQKLQMYVRTSRAPEAMPKLHMYVYIFIRAIGAPPLRGLSRATYEQLPPKPTKGYKALVGFCTTTPRKPPAGLTHEKTRCSCQAE